LRLIGLAGDVGSMTAFQAVIDGEPNAAQLRVKVNDWLNDRWVGKLPPSAAAPLPHRYWGAQ
ncbi:MAG: hypothetical protein HY236_08020, partial [Acidobacteria bacterium]|nr:hypothetical protein [Acidobacteriota bacterium]